MGDRLMEEVSLTKKMYGWTKYGGARKGLVSEELDEWYCTLCGSHNLKHLPAYFMPEDDSQREYMRLCTRCKNVALRLEIDTYEELLARKVANLLSIPTRYIHG